MTNFRKYYKYVGGSFNIKKLPLILVWLLISWTANGQMDDLGYPTYDVVVRKFFNEYSRRYIPLTAKINFEKRPTGWHITVIDHLVGSEIIKDEMFWNKEKKKFQKIDFAETKGEYQGEIDEYQKDWSIRYYSICPYFGYPHWDWDVIQEFKDVNNLPDSTLYALGRAYSSYASNLLNISGLAKGKHQFNLPQGKNCMTSEQLEKYRYYRHLAIEKFKQLTALNPKYETIVGAIGIKTSNEYVTSFLDLRICQNEQEANKEIIDGLYSDFYISAAKNYLNSCDKNAILFTHGDFDTYSLLYVQSKYGFRTDVLVVNVSLLQTDRYINSLREQILNAPGLPISLTPEEISENKRSVILIKRRNKNPIMLADLISYVKDDKNKENYGSTDYHCLSSNKFRLNQNENLIEWEVDKQYFLRSQLIILDLLATSKWERPIYFTTTCSPEAYVGLNDYLKLEGLVYRLTSTKKDITDDELGSVNSSIMYSNLMTKFDFSGFKINSNKNLFSIVYRIPFCRLAETLLNENKADSAKLVLDKCIEIMPNETIYYDLYTIPLIENYYKLQEFEKANKIAKILAYNLNKNINNYNNATQTDERLSAIKKLKEIATKYNQGKILKLLEK
jgi:hypothetical protein